MGCPVVPFYFNSFSKIRTEIIVGKYFEKTVTDKTVAEMLNRFIKDHSPTVEVNTQKSYKTSLNHLIPFLVILLFLM